MAENDNRNVENFVLGMIVAAIIYFLFRREISKLNTGGNGKKNLLDNGAPAKSSGCGCGGGDSLPTNPGISLGNQSYNSTANAFGSSSVAAAPYQSFFELDAN